MALVQRGTSTTMFKICFDSSAKSGMSWKGEAGSPVRVDSMKTRCSEGQREREREREEESGWRERGGARLTRSERGRNEAARIETVLDR